MKHSQSATRVMQLHNDSSSSSLENKVLGTSPLSGHKCSSKDRILTKGDSYRSLAKQQIRPTDSPVMNLLHSKTFSSSPSLTDKEPSIISNSREFKPKSTQVSPSGLSYLNGSEILKTEELIMMRFPSKSSIDLRTAKSISLPIQNTIPMDVLKSANVMYDPQTRMLPNMAQLLGDCSDSEVQKSWGTISSGVSEDSTGPQKSIGSQESKEKRAAIQSMPPLSSSTTKKSLWKKLITNMLPKDGN